MTRRGEDAVERTLRWMTENLTGAYNATHPPGHPHAGDYCTNSGTCILACCYINALGKVLLKGGPPKGGRRDFARFQAFLQHCMADFLTESSSRTFLSTPKGRNGGDEWLYEVFRCGFIHGYYPTGHVGWGRANRCRRYWFTKRGRLILNIDELVRGFLRGIEEFRRLVAADAHLRNSFMKYIIAD